MKSKPVDRIIERVNGRLEEIAMESVPHHLIKYTQIIDAAHITPMPTCSDDEKKNKMRHYDYP